MREQDESKFDGGGVKAWLKEEQEPITAQNVEQSLLLTSEETRRWPTESVHISGTPLQNVKGCFSGNGCYSLISQEAV